MLNKFTDKAQRIISLSENIAFELGVCNVSVEHLLLAFLKIKECKLKQLLEKNNITYEIVKEKIIKIIGKKTNKPFYIEYSKEYKAILENALLIAKKKNEDKVSIDILSIAMLKANEKIIVELLDNDLALINKMLEEIEIVVKRSSDLDNIADLTNLNQKALKKIPILIHRDQEINNLIELLLRKQKQNAIIVGNPGVGKTALVEYLAHLINIGSVPPYLKDKIIYELDIASLIAGTKYRGEFEDKLKKILRRVKDDKNAIIFIDEFHNIVGAGGAEGAIDASNIIKPYLSSNEICCLGATTYDEYIKIIEKEKALERRFQLIKLKEPNVEETIDILLALKDSFIKYHKINISDNNIKDVVNLSKQYVFDRHFPDKAIDILDLSCVRCKSNNQESLSKDIIIKVIEDNYNVKIEVINKAKNLENKLNEILLGQEKAIKNICNQIRYIELGMNDSNRPLGVYLFVGATGVGKTETTKQIARYYFGNKEKYIKLDMSEYNEPSSITKLIGSPPGYVGFEKQSLLVDHIRNNPYSVVVLDEVEKAHIDVLDVFLNVFDEGYFVDASKRKIDFTNSIIIMTSNLGFSEKAFHRNALGYLEKSSKTDEIEKIINTHFRPEFLNRIDDIIFFDNINDDTCIKLINKYIDEYQEKIEIPISKNTILNNVCKDQEMLKYGARGIKRKVKKEIIKQLEENIVYKV